MSRLLICCAVILSVSPVFAQGKKSPTAKSPKLNTCVVTGESLGGETKPIEVAYKGKNASYKGKIVKVCCGGCVTKVKADPDKFFAKVYGK